MTDVLPLVDVYADESCKDAHKYLVLGGVCIENKNVPKALDLLQQVRTAHGRTSEVKWSECKRQKLDFYKDFVNVFFDLSAKDEMHFQALYVDTSTFKHSKFNDGDRDLGFNKLIYQLLLHKFGCRLGNSHRLHVYLDARVTKHQPEAMRPMLNADLKRRGVKTEPFKRITFQDSAKSDLVQLADLLVGTVGFTKNLHHNRPDCAAHKIALKEHIIRRALANEPTNKLNARGTKRFYVWKFQFKGG